MKNFIWLDDKNKKINKFNRNYYFAVTVFIVLFNIFNYMFGTLPDVYDAPWDSFSWGNLFRALANSYAHFNWQHTLLNMLCFFVAGLYLERKTGSIKFALFIVVLSFFTAFASCTNALKLNWVGFSGVNYGLYGYIITEFVFTVCQNSKRYLFNTVSGAVVVALIYFAMCFNGGTSTVSFVWYPYDLLHNLGHASGFFVGLLFGLYEQICSIIPQTD